MKQMLSIVTLLCLAGCSGEGAGQLGPFGRLDVTPALQDDCAGVAGGDPNIEALIFTIEEGRLQGGSFSLAVATINAACSFEDCITCGVAVVNQVFGI